ncbi:MULTISPECIES: hypothetical protein [Paenibacillus]|uniref:Uncharacterized protein n=3 Tax=Paenibacillus TaxID=44249 RepID=G4HEU0_9BACL|nr:MULTISPECIES: hypothetical protein [Paenibacillus]ANY72012.1 hypothetical protein BBD41_05075 [Paenibacillus ihbetae]EHB65359.1 hypothetical protein PaelaDRAFT_2501 [Paenibacillus lactis 154]MBP1896732.1 hypothetical protein [Paenibacillus lactis]MCM3495409.1 hypothetical protein [Paenibacillus lactis]OOC60682.1 hypothetical protein BBD40_01585 [Paenibacillus ihbetae]
MYIIVIALAIIGGVSTLLVGLSKENQKENPNYMRKTRKNLTKLLIIYLASIIAFIAIWLIFK